MVVHISSLFILEMRLPLDIRYLVSKNDAHKVIIRSIHKESAFIIHSTKLVLPNS